MNPLNSLRRHPFLCLAGLLLAGAALWIGYFLATFDLDRYRDQIAQELSKRLQTPVRLGEAHLELREGGLAFRFAELQVGTAQTPMELSARKLWLQLAWHGLLVGKPILTEVALDAPRLRVTPLPPPAAAEPPPPDRFSLASLSDLRVRRVEIHEGAVEFGWRHSSGTEHALSVGDLSVELADLGLARTIVFDATGNLLGPKGPARLAINGSVDLPASGRLRESTWDLALTAKGLDATQLAGLLSDHVNARAEGTGDLDLFIKGDIASGVTFQTELTGKQLSVHPESSQGEPLLLNHLQLAGIWQQEGNIHHIRKLALQFNDLRLAGEITMQTTADSRQVNGTLNNCTLPLDALRQWVPPALRATNPLLSRRLPGGLLALSNARFRAEIPADPQGSVSFFLDELTGEVKGLSWDLGAERKAELTSLLIRLENNRWHLEQGIGTLAGLPASLAATVFAQSDGQPQFSIDMTFNGTADQFVALQSQPLPAELAIAGNLAIRGNLAGTPSRYNFDVQAELAQLNITYGEHLHLPPKPGNFLSVRGQGALSTLTLEQGTLVLAPLTGQLTGTVDWSEAPTANLSAHIELADLTSAYEPAPAIARLQLQGGMAIDLAANGPLASLQRETTVELMNVGIPARGIVADITHLNGRLRQDGKGIRSERLTARLGNSPVILQARVADLETPRLELGVKAAAIRANELIFHSDRAILHDVSGQLLIDRDGIAFLPVQVRLAGGTRAAVRGSVKDFANPRVELEILGDFAKVEEIVGLWTDQSPAAKAARQARPHKDSAHFPVIRIQMMAKQGDLYGMKFSNASALIVPSKGQLLLHPLDFQVGEGSCTTQVLVDYSGSKTILRTSGHVENVDAYQVVNELLRRKSIMRGSLRGDFYLQGELGAGRFLPTSFGNINATVRDGVMRHSPILGTVFSLLNVSQLFSFKLPDVNLEGVPFTRLTAELAIDKGVMSSDLVVIDSEAMNMAYIGKFDMVKDDLDVLVVVKPLGTIDKVVTSLPIAGWILGGEEKALITTQFRVTGPAGAPKIEAIPISAMSKGVLGLFQRTLGLPLKLIEDPAILWGGGGERKN